MIKQENTQEKKFFIKDCSVIKTVTKKNGTLVLCSTKLQFFHNIFQITFLFSFICNPYESKDSHVTFVKYNDKPHLPFIKCYSLSQLSQLFLRKFIHRNSAVELFFLSGHSLYLYFYSRKAHNQFIEAINSLRKKGNFPFLKQFSPSSYSKNFKQSKAMQKWMKFKLSTFGYLMQLNLYSSRSYKDLTQYPVFPWILHRDLSKTMGAMGSQDRVSQFLARYENVDPFTPVPKYHFGSHYSSPAIVLQYLIRLSPFTEGAIELQGGHFDLADRLFFNVEDQWSCAIEELSDLRELIPEWYYCPEMFINLEHQKFGCLQDGTLVNHVKIEEESQNPWKFVEKLRRTMESEKVDREIESWIDLIFGFKQRGKEAEKNLNVFFYLTYEDSVDFDKIDDELLRISTEAQVVHFGQTPIQLIKKNKHNPRPKRELADSYQRQLTNPNLITKIYSVKEVLAVQQQTDRQIIAAQYYNGGNNQPYLIVLQKHGVATIFKYFLALIKQVFRVILTPDEKFPFKMPSHKEKYFEFSDPLTYDRHTSTVTSMAMDKKEQILITGFTLKQQTNYLIGTVTGECIQWQVTQQVIKEFHRFYDHTAQINSIYISKILKSFVTCGCDGKVLIYNLYNGKHLRTLFHPDKYPIQNVVLSDCPLISVIFFSNVDSVIYCFSINGQLLQKVHSNSPKLVSPSIIKTIDNMDILYYGTTKGNVLFLNLPSLELRNTFVLSKENCPLTYLTLHKSEWHLFGGNEEGKISFISSPNSV